MPPAAAPMQVSAPMLALKIEEVMEAAKLFFEFKLTDSQPHRETIKDYTADLSIMIADHLAKANSEPITASLEWLSVISMESERAFEIGIPEVLERVVPKTFSLTAADDTVLSFAIKKLELAKNKDGHNTDPRWFLILHPRADDTKPDDIAGDVAKALEFIGITVTPQSVKHLYHKISGVFIKRTMCKFTIDQRKLQNYIYNVVDHKLIKTSKTHNDCTIRFGREFCHEWNLCKFCYGANNKCFCQAPSSSVGGGKRKLDANAKAAYFARLMSKQARR